MTFGNVVVSDSDDVQVSADKLFDEDVALPTVNHPLYVRPRVPAFSTAKAAGLKCEGKVLSITAYEGRGEWSFTWTFDNVWSRFFSRPGLVTLAFQITINAPDVDHLGSSPTYELDLRPFLTSAVLGAVSIQRFQTGWLAKTVATGLYAYAGKAPSFVLKVFQDHTWCGDDVQAGLRLDVSGAYSASYLDVKKAPGLEANQPEDESAPSIQESSDSFELLSDLETS